VHQVHQDFLFYFEPNYIATMMLPLRRISFISNKHFSILLKLVIVILCLFVIISSFAQQKDSLNKLDDTTFLQNVTVTAFASQGKWKDAPVSIAVVTKNNLQRYDLASLVPSMNSVAGVRMEERSPGSYRFSIRGSLLRSPFGVRNIKIYWDDIPFTDATGNTYLQLIDVNTVNSVEIIKGPSASFYGANTQGTVILHSDNYASTQKNNFNVGITGGSFGMFNEQAAWKYNSKSFVSNLQQGHLQNDGYRQQSALRRDVVQWNSKWNMSAKESLSFLAFYSNLHYETPGGITQYQMDSLPTLARQPTSTLPGSVEQQAGVYNKTFFAGTTLQSSFSKKFGNTTSLVFNHTDFKNPFITNYEHRNESNYSGRTDFHYTYEQTGFKLQANAGAEVQYNDSYIRVYDNNKGIPGDGQYKDKVHTTQYFLFAQVNVNFGSKLLLQAGISRNQLQYWFNEITDSSTKYPLIKKAGPTACPRFAVSYALSKNISVFATAAKGFSPPTLAEVRPSTGIFDTELQAEYGWNYEAGFKGALINNRLEFNTSFYYFELKHAVVLRTDSTGADYYVNSGGTIQKGVEVWFNARIINNSKNFISVLNIWNSFSYQPYRFDEYVVGNSVYSGNKVTGVPRTINVSGVDIKSRNNYYANMTFNYTSSIPLNDANTVFAKPYHLLQMKIGKQINLNKCRINVFAGADNLLNEIYSLGNDINALGGRYFNPAPERNYYAGVKFEF
jgi:iron complex outermembrane receptor protein